MNKVEKYRHQNQVLRLRRKLVPLEIEHKNLIFELKSEENSRHLSVYIYNKNINKLDGFVHYQPNEIFNFNNYDKLFNIIVEYVNEEVVKRDMGYPSIFTYRFKNDTEPPLNVAYDNALKETVLDKVKNKLKKVKLKSLEWKDDKLQIINNGENQKEVNFKTA